MRPMLETVRSVVLDVVLDDVHCRKPTDRRSISFHARTCSILPKGENIKRLLYIQNQFKQIYSRTDCHAFVPAISRTTKQCTDASAEARPTTREPVERSVSIFSDTELHVAKFVQIIAAWFCLRNHSPQIASHFLEQTMQTRAAVRWIRVHLVTEYS